MIRSRIRTLAVMRQVRKEIKYLLNLKKNYPDIKVNEDNLQEVLNSLDAKYNSVRSMR